MELPSSKRLSRRLFPLVSSPVFQGNCYVFAVLVVVGRLLGLALVFLLGRVESLRFLFLMGFLLEGLRFVVCLSVRVFQFEGYLRQSVSGV